MTPMNAQTLEALKASIAKWERNAEAERPDEYLTSDVDCPLCVLFIRSDCDGCPVFERAGERECRGTPYRTAVSARFNWNRDQNGAARARAAARDEVAFLKSLLPVQP